MVKKNKFYTVWVGKNPGVYLSWATCKAQVDGVKNAKYKGFSTKSEAETALKEDYRKFYRTKTNKVPSFQDNSLTPFERLKNVSNPPIWDSISVDAACSSATKIVEYQGVDTKTGELIFRKKFAVGTNNIGEFLALVHALALFWKKNPTIPIYTDSKTAMSWYRNQQVKTTFTHPLTDQLLARATGWLKQNETKNPILKWDTKNWGEIPADFGRK